MGTLETVQMPLYGFPESIEDVGVLAGVPVPSPKPLLMQSCGFSRSSLGSLPEMRMSYLRRQPQDVGGRLSCRAETDDGFVGERPPCRRRTGRSSPA